MIGVYDIAAPGLAPSLEPVIGDLSKSLKNYISISNIRRTSRCTRAMPDHAPADHGSDDPVIQAFFRAVDAPIREHIAQAEA